MKKNILIFFIYLLIHFCVVQFHNGYSILFVIIFPLLVLAIFGAAFYSFRKIKRIKWNIPLWLFIALSNILIFQPLFNELGIQITKADGTPSHLYLGGKPELNQLWHLLIFLVPFFLLLWGSWKEKVSAWQLKWATFIMLTAYPFACIYHCFKGQSWLAQLFSYMKG